MNVRSQVLPVFDAAAQLFAGGGETGALMRTLDWTNSPLGPPSGWPQSLRTAVSILLNSRHPMFVFWGPERVKIYNDGYRPIAGGKHPWALGRPGRDVWPEIWDTIGPMTERVIAHGEATWSDDLMLFMERNGFPEEVYFTFSYSPIRDESGGVGGLFCACTETTQKVLSERRLRTLHALASRVAEADTVAETCERACRVLDKNPHDVPFSMLYLLAVDGSLRLAASGGAVLDEAWTPRHVPPQETSRWPFAAAIESGEPQRVSPLRGCFSSLPAGPWPEPPDSAWVLPLVGSAGAKPRGVLVVGTSARRPFDEAYRDFLSLVASQIEASIAEAQASEVERRRLEALAELDRAKTDFFSSVSHEFRTPLALILGHLEDLLNHGGEAISGGPRGRLQVAQRNALRLLKLVNTLLDFSRLEAGRMEAVHQPVDLARLTADVASGFRAVIERAGLRLEVDCAALSEAIHVDPDMWEKILLNLLSNAFKFTFQGQIGVTLRERGESVELRVQDTGIGIAAEEIPRLFERFHRVQGARARTHEGSGIGLSLVQELVKLHGGCVDVESAPGAGTCFTVSIPRTPRQSDGRRDADGRRLSSTSLGAAPFVEEALRWLPLGDAQEPEEDPAWPQHHTDGHAGRGPGEDEQAGARARILVVDDNADMRAYLTRLLSRQYVVDVAADGAAALAAIRAQLPDLVLADVMMPVLGGFELLRALRRDPSTRDLPLIVLSARAGEEATVEGLEAGADEYLVKPFSARELRARVRSQLVLKQTRDELRAAREARLATMERTLHASELFIGVLGHDLRTPLHATLMGAKALEAMLSSTQPLDRQTALEAVARISTSAERMARMIEQVLDFTRARLGRGITLSRRRTDLGALLRDVLDELVMRYADLEVACEVRGNAVGDWDGDRLARLASNLIGNALQHGRAPISVCADGTHPARVQLEVRNGGAIPEALLPVLFEPFRGSDGGSAGAQGLGLGLFIAQQIALAHGGDIRVTSREAEGTCIVVTLPRAPPEAS